MSVPALAGCSVPAVPELSARSFKNFCPWAGLVYMSDFGSWHAMKPAPFGILSLFDYGFHQQAYENCIGLA